MNYITQWSNNYVFIKKYQYIYIDKKWYDYVNLIKNKNMQIYLKSMIIKPIITNWLYLQHNFNTIQQIFSYYPTKKYLIITSRRYILDKFMNVGIYPDVIIHIDK